MNRDIARVAAAAFRHQVRAARALEPGDKLLAGPRLFERACVLATAGLRHRDPAADEAAIRARLHRQLAILRRLDAGR